MKAAHILLIVGALALSGCGLLGRTAARAPAPELPPDEVGAPAQNRASLSAGGVDYVVEYRSHGLWRDANGTAGANVGAPQVTVGRADGTALTETDILAARGVAKAYCAENPGFRRDVIFGDGVVIEEGRVVFSEICD